MVDVMFFLLAFFMLFATFKSTPAAIDVDLPRAATAVLEPASELVVTLDAGGQMFLDGRSVSVAQLEALVAQALRRRPDQLVIVKADKEVRYDRVVEAIDALRRAGAFRLGLAVQLQPAAAPSR